MAISKVIYGTKVLVDLTSDTVDAAHLAKGYTAHSANGNAISGSLDPDKTALDFLAGKELPQEVLDKVVYAYSYAFSNLRNRTIRLPNFTGGKEGAFSHHLFSNNDTVERICIPRASYIAWGGFVGASNLKTVVLGTEFSGVVYCALNEGFKGSMYVPDSLLDAYKTSDSWKSSASQIKPISELPEADKDLLA